MYISLYGEAENSFLEVLAKRVNEHQGSLSPQQMGEIIVWAKQQAEHIEKEEQEKMKSYHLTLNGKEALNEIFRCESVTFVFDSSDLNEKATSILRLSLDEEEWEEMMEEGVDICRTLFFSNGNWAKEEAKELALTETWKLIVLEGRKHPLNPNQNLLIYNPSKRENN